MVSSINFYRAALEKDPNYALAYTGMAVSYSTIGIYGPLAAREAGPKALDAARKAVDLDDDLAEAHVALGVVKLLYEWDWEGARRELERGIQLDPNTIGHTPYGYYLYTMGRWDEAIAELERTSAMSPGWRTANLDVWWALYAARRFDEAARRCQQAIALDPNDPGAYLVLGQVEVQQHMYKQAIATLQQAVKLDGSDLKTKAELAYAYAISGDHEKAFAILTDLKRSSISLAPYLIAEIYVALGDKDQAFTWLDKAFEDRYAFLSDVRITPQFDSLRSDSRYAALVRRMNLSP
jgi:tetratricopeptide (TPR) repeat protein